MRIKPRKGEPQGRPSVPSDVWKDARRASSPSRAEGARNPAAARREKRRRRATAEASGMEERGKGLRKGPSPCAGKLIRTRWRW